MVMSPPCLSLSASLSPSLRSCVVNAMVLSAARAAWGRSSIQLRCCRVAHVHAASVWFPVCLFRIQIQNKHTDCPFQFTCMSRGQMYSVMFLRVLTSSRYLCICRMALLKSDSDVLRSHLTTAWWRGLIPASFSEFVQFQNRGSWWFSTFRWSCW